MVGPFFLAFFVYHAAIAEARKCETEESTSYLRAEGLRLMEFAQETLHDVTLNTCARSCRESQKSYDCVSFEYDPNTQECSLHKSSGQPFGPSILAKTDLSRSFFEEVCLPTRLLCPTPYAFERYPQHALFGHSLEVLKVQGGLPECLSTCLDATSKLNIACRSVMFYYTTGECILNRETKTTAPALFSAVTDDDVVVDYFENNCFDVVCPSPSAALYWLRSEEFGIGHDKDIIIESMGIDDCKKLCSENEVAGEIFPCKAFVYSSAKEECHLSAESGLKKGREAFELSPISNGEYHEKICLTSTFRCKEASFEVTPKKQLVNVTSKDECYLSEESQYTMATRFLPASNADYFDKICDYLPGRAFTSLSEQPFPLTSQTSFPTLNPTTLPLINATEQSITLSHLQSPDPEGFVPFTTDLFTASPPPPLDNSIDEGIHEIERDEKQIQSIHHSESADEDALSEESDGLFQANRPTVHAQMSTECRLSGISLILNFEQPTSGAIFIKEFFASCRVLFTDELTATLEIPFPRSDDPAPRCPGEEIRPGFWSFVVVVQRNEMKVPSLMTSSDRIFNVTCDYSSITEEELRLQPEMENSPSSTPSGRVQMSILLGGVPVSSVALGEEVELRWTLRPLSPEEAAQKERLGYFINECVAERIGGPPPEPEPLKLIFAGCPEENVRNRLMRYPVVQVEGGFSTKMKVICEESETQNGSQVQSFGKRKKRQSIEELSKMMKRLRPQFASPRASQKGREDVDDSKENRVKSITFESPRSFVKPSMRDRRSVTLGILTITDKAISQMPTRRTPSTETEKDALSSESPSSLCLTRPHFFSVSVVALVLFIGQLFVIINCVRRRLRLLPSEAAKRTNGYGPALSTPSAYQSGSLSPASSVAAPPSSSFGASPTPSSPLQHHHPAASHRHPPNHGHYPGLTLPDHREPQFII